MKHNKFLNFLPILIIIFIGLTIYLTNLSGNFWLTGWDNLHPEFNFKINIGRAFFSAWQEYQSLGLPAGNGHAAEFFREILLAGLSLLFSLQSIRKIYLLLMLIAGPIGMYLFLNKFIIKDTHSYLKSIASLFGGLFYLLHIATVQIFYLPFEAFITFYGIIPWMIFAIYEYIHNSTKKNLFLLILVHLIGSSIFFIPTLFIVYAVILGLLCLDLLKITSIKKILKTYFLILISNFFWLLPFLYYSISNIGSQLNSYLNQLYSVDIYLKNFVFGGFLNALLLKGFLFGTTDQISPKNYDYLMAVWRDYFNNPLIIYIALALSLIFIIGIISSLKRKVNYSFILIFLIFFSLIAIDTFPFKFLNETLRKISLFDQIFRNPYTKFANVLLLAESIFFAVGVQTIITFAKSILKKFPYFIIALLFLMQFIVVLPIWQGNFIYSNLKLSIPQEYFDLFNYFKNQSDGRIANFPQPSPNGWELYNWGYRGSGFLWYGIKQPILDRAFDVWDKNSENYYWEIYQSTYSNDPIQTRNVLNKYHIRWLLIDNNIIGSTSTQTIDYDRFKKLLDSIPEVQYVTNFGKIELYEVNSNTTKAGYVEIISNIPDVSPEYKWSDSDAAFKELGTYQYDSDRVETQIFYPFRSIFTGRGINEDKLSVIEYSDSYTFSSTVPYFFEDARLVFPKLKSDDITEYDKNNLLKTRQKIPTVYINGRPIEFVKDFTNKQTVIDIGQNNQKNINLEVNIPKILGYNSFDSNVNNNSYLTLLPKNCDKFQKGEFNKTTNSQNQIELISKNSGNCFDIDVPQITHKNGYIFAIKSQNIQGRGLLFTLINKSTNTIDLQTRLSTEKKLVSQYYIVPPKNQYGLGYSLNFDNYSLGNKQTTNIFDSVTINQIPYDFLTGIKIIKNGVPLNSNSEKINADINHPNYAFYDINLLTTDIRNNSSLILYQSYSPGWIALSNWKILPHITINNWANGWKLDPGYEKITLIYWPQYLEFFGLGALIIILILVLL